MVPFSPCLGVCKVLLVNTWLSVKMIVQPILHTKEMGILFRARPLCLQEHGGHKDNNAEEEEVSGGGTAADAEQTDGRRVILDWKGDPMTINPGDKLPFF